MDTQDDTQEVKLMSPLKEFHKHRMICHFCGGRVFFNVNGSFAQDVYIYLNK